jgi:hypothetical protein
VPESSPAPRASPAQGLIGNSRAEGIHQRIKLGSYDEEEDASALKSGGFAAKGRSIGFRRCGGTVYSTSALSSIPLVFIPKP